MSRFLAVDDDAAALLMIKTVLTGAGHEVATAPDAEEAFRKLRETSFDALVLDIVMPGESGLSILKSLRGEARWKHLPVLLLSSRRKAEDRVHGLRQGADDYMGKPFDPEELVARAERLVTRKAPETGLSGTIEDFSLADLLQNLAQARKTGALEVAWDLKSATVLIVSGEIKGVWSNKLRGEDALLEILSWREGSFQFDANAHLDPNATLPAGIQLNATLLESAWLEDEFRARELSSVSITDSLMVTDRPFPAVPEEFEKLPVADVYYKLVEFPGLSLQEILSLEIAAAPRVLLSLALLVEYKVLAISEPPPVEAEEPAAPSGEAAESPLDRLVSAFEAQSGEHEEFVLAFLCQPTELEKLLSVVETIPNAFFRVERKALMDHLRLRQRGAIRLSTGRSRFLLSMQPVTPESVRRDPTLTTASAFVFWLSSEGWQPMLQECLRKVSENKRSTVGLVVPGDPQATRPEKIALPSRWSFAAEVPEGFAEICGLLASSPVAAGS